MFADAEWQGLAPLSGRLVDYAPFILPGAPPLIQREFFIDILLVRNHFIIVMIRWTSLAPWEFEFPFSGSLTSTLLVPRSHPLSDTPSQPLLKIVGPYFAPDISPQGIRLAARVDRTSSRGGKGIQTPMARGWST